jgi:hypothetical protein
LRLGAALKRHARPLLKPRQQIEAAQQLQVNKDEIDGIADFLMGD